MGDAREGGGDGELGREGGVHDDRSMGRASDGEGCVEDVPEVDPSRIGFFPRGGAGDAGREDYYCELF